MNILKKYLVALLIGAFVTGAVNIPVLADETIDVQADIAEEIIVNDESIDDNNSVIDEGAEEGLTEEQSFVETVPFTEGKEEEQEGNTSLPEDQIEENTAPASTEEQDTAVYLQEGSEEQEDVNAELSEEQEAAGLQTGSPEGQAEVNTESPIGQDEADVMPEQNQETEVFLTESPQDQEGLSTDPKLQELEIYLEESPVEEEFLPDGQSDDAEELLEGYADQKLKEQLPSRSRRLLRAPRNNASKLKGMNVPVYSELYRRITAVAAGEQSSTEFTLDFSDLGIEKTGWTAAELGVSSLTAVVNGNTVISPEAKNAINDMFLLDIPLVVKTLMADCPYEMYWYDKTQSMKYTGYGFSLRGNVLSITGPLSFRFPVASEYAVSDYAVDTSLGSGIRTAVQTASSIVSKHSAKNDYDKLTAYRDEICDRVSYNYSAAEGNTDYGNPWQIIWVFDEDPATKVVCEGYSKAFQYLCDLSTFRNNITACTVTGTMNGGDHMWNLVKMEDGKNYLADVTNTDNDSGVYADYLFLAGTASGTVSSFYTFSISSFGDITYVYDDDTRAVFSEGELVLASRHYGDESGTATNPCEAGHDYQFDGWLWSSDRTSAEAVFVCSRDSSHRVTASARVSRAFDPSAGGFVCSAVLDSGRSPDHQSHSGRTVAYITGWYKSSAGSWYYFNNNHSASVGWQKIDGSWYYFAASGVMQTGWQKVSGKRYYMNSAGAMQTGWQKISGSWYYLDASGVMATGWKKISGKWYYMNSAGVMQTGWQKIGGRWYYLDASGAMTTGWKKIGGRWYYLDTSGAMATGWKKISGKWYYMNSAGVMQTGWQKIGGSWYYLDAAGVMTTGWKKISGKWYYMNSSGVMQTGRHKIDGKWYTFGSSGALK